MVFEQRRLLTRRVATSAASLAFVAVVAAACSSAVGVLSGAPASSAVLSATAAATQASTVPISLATAAPTLSSANGSAVALQEQMVSVIKQVSPSVVEISTDQGLGSGVVYDNKGDIVTNAHVVGSATKFTVTLSNTKSYA